VRPALGLPLATCLFPCNFVRVQSMDLYHYYLHALARSGSGAEKKKNHKKANHHNRVSYFKKKRSGWGRMSGRGARPHTDLIIKITVSFLFSTVTAQPEQSSPRPTSTHRYSRSVNLQNPHPFFFPGAVPIPYRGPGGRGLVFIPMLPIDATGPGRNLHTEMVARGKKQPF